MSRAKKNWDQLVNYDGSYGVDVANGLYPGSGGYSVKGQKGLEGEQGLRGFEGPRGPRGFKGQKGHPGAKGDAGKSAFFEAVENGFIGTQNEWLVSLRGNTGGQGQKGQQGQKGKRGDSAYEQAVEAGFVGSKEEWLISLVGADGEKGESAPLFTFKTSVDTPADLGNIPTQDLENGDVYLDSSTDNLYVWDGTKFGILTEALPAVKGERGTPGPRGFTGDSTYEVAVRNGFAGSESDFIESLKGEAGTEGEKGDEGDQGERGFRGIDGTNGRSAYEIAIDQGFVGSESQFISSLIGPIGPQGESAYDIFLEQTGLNLTKSQWLESLKGEPGQDVGLNEDDFYNKTQLDQLLVNEPDPEDAYSIESMPEENKIVSPAVVDFRSQNPADRIYNKGLVSVGSGVSVVGAPSSFTPPFVITNTVINNPTLIRDSEYTVVQSIYSVRNTDGVAYYRSARPGARQFGNWNELAVESNRYYDKTEVDNAIQRNERLLDHEGPEITLKNPEGTYYGKVRLDGVNGINVYSDSHGVKIDGTSLSGTKFKGVLTESGQDPNVILRELYGNSTQPSVGDYFIHSYTEGEVNPGDWLIYSDAGTWDHVKMDFDPAVSDIQVELESEEYLSIDKSNPSTPVISFNSDKVLNPSEALSFATRDELGLSFGDRTLDSLQDVITQWEEAFPQLDPTYFETHVETPDEVHLPGTFCTHGDGDTLYLARTDQYGSNVVTNLHTQYPSADHIEITYNLERYYEEVEISTVGLHRIEMKLKNPEILYYLQVRHAPSIKITLVNHNTPNRSIIVWNEVTQRWVSQTIEETLDISALPELEP